MFMTKKSTKAKKIPGLEKIELIDFLGTQKAHRLHFSNGLKVIHLRRKIAPVFSYQTWYNVGSRDEDPGFSGMAHLFEHMMFKGTKQRKPGVFDRTMESNGARDLNAFTSTDYTAYVQSLPVEAFPLVAQLESERMTSLILSKPSFDSERKVVHNERKEHQENNPEGKMFEELSKAAFEKHPYGWPVIGFAQDLDRMGTKDLRDFYQRFYAPNNAVIVVVGDIDRDLVAKEISKRYGKFARSEGKRHTPTTEPKQDKERVVELELNIQIEKAYVGYKIPPATHDDSLALTMLGSLLTSGRSSRLYQALVDKGHAMEVNSGSGAGKDPGLFYVVLSAQAGKGVKACLDIMDKEISRVETETLSEADMRRVRNKMKTDFHQALMSNASIANFIGHNETIYGDFTKEFEQFRLLDRVGPQDLKRVAKEYFRKGGRTIVIGRPKREGV
jgi:zinc protease